MRNGRAIATGKKFSPGRNRRNSLTKRGEGRRLPASGEIRNRSAEVRRFAQMEERKAPTDEKETRMFYEDQTVIRSIHPWDFFIRGTTRSLVQVSLAEGLGGGRRPCGCAWVRECRAHRAWGRSQGAGVREQESGSRSQGADFRVQISSFNFQPFTSLRKMNFLFNEF